MVREAHLLAAEAGAASNGFLPGLQAMFQRRWQAADEPTLLYFDEWVIDRSRRTLQRADGERVRLTAAEFNILCALVEQPHQAVHRDQLTSVVRTREWTPLDRSIDVLVGRIRKKIEKDPAEPTLIRTVRYVGYVFTPDVMIAAGTEPELQSRAA